MSLDERLIKVEQQMEWYDDCAYANDEMDRSVAVMR